MKSGFMLVPLSVGLTALAGWTLCRAAGFDPHERDMLVAAGVCIVAGTLACVPLLMARRGSQATIAQAALVGTVIHLFATLALGLALVFLKLAGYGAFLYWLMAFYLLTLAVLVKAFAAAIRSAPVTATGPR